MIIGIKVDEITNEGKAKISFPDPDGEDESITVELGPNQFTKIDIKKEWYEPGNA